MTYVDDIVIIGRSLASMKEALQLLEEASKKVELVVNEGETKYMVAANTHNFSKSHAIEIGRFNFEKVYSFAYFGSLVTSENSVSEEITQRLVAANRLYFGQKNLA
jgi:hypothetical protein